MPSLRMPIGASKTLAAADDLDGDSANSASWLDVTGGRALIIQRNDGTNGTAGIDVVESSFDGGKTWATDTTVTDAAGAALTNGVFNVAGTEPAGAALFLGGPYDKGPTLIRIVRLVGTNANSAAWVTGAPSVKAHKLG